MKSIASVSSVSSSHLSTTLVKIQKVALVVTIVFLGVPGILVLKMFLYFQLIFIYFFEALLSTCPTCEPHK